MVRVGQITCICKRAFERTMFKKALKKNGLVSGYRGDPTNFGGGVGWGVGGS